MCASTDPENTTPGIIAIAADCEGLQLGRSPQSGGAALHTCLPVATSSANNPPPPFGSNTRRPPAPYDFSLKVMSDSATYIFFPSLAEPHWIPPKVPPRPTRVCHRIAPLFSASRPCATPFFWLTSSTPFPF